MTSYPAPVIGHWMSTSLITMKPEKTLDEAKELMQEARIRHLLIVGPKGELVGILSNRDADRHGDLTAKIDAVMTPRAKLKVTDAYDTVRSAAETMCREKISALPVLQGETLAGIVTSEDLLWALLQDETHEG